MAETDSQYKERGGFIPLVPRLDILAAPSQTKKAATLFAAPVVATLPGKAYRDNLTPYGVPKPSTISLRMVWGRSALPSESFEQ